jgi:hypothetical protein
MFGTLATHAGVMLCMQPRASGGADRRSCEGLDLVADEVRGCHAYNERTKTITTPKTDVGIRNVTIPAALLPLLERAFRARRARR